MIKTYSKKVGKVGYYVLSKQIKERLHDEKKSVRIYPVYDKTMAITGIKVTAMINESNKWINSMINYTLRLQSNVA